MKSARDRHLFEDGRKRILALDGGGVRGLVTLGMLLKVESILASRSPEPEKFRLCDYFDLIGGTSTGALIATLLALGYKVEDVITLYRDMAPRVFRKKRLFAGIQSKFDSAAFRKAVDRVLADFLQRSGRDPGDIKLLRMGSELLRTGLAVVTKRIDTGSVWVLANNRRAKFWDRDSVHWRDQLDAEGVPPFFPNSDYELGTVVRASASAPFYLDGVDVRISPNQVGHFLDGGASPFNNPSQELFLMTTLKDWKSPQTKGHSAFGFDWKTGADSLFMLSLGTGTWRNRIDPKAFAAKSAGMKAVTALRGIIDDADRAATTFMQAISVGPSRHVVDGNLLDMRDLRIVPEPLLTYCRVNPSLESDWLAGLGDEFKMSAETLNHTREIDRADKANLDRLLKIGVAAGERMIREAELPEAFDIVAPAAR
jgi:hypothetical protein